MATRHEIDAAKARIELVMNSMFLTNGNSLGAPRLIDAKDEDELVDFYPRFGLSADEIGWEDWDDFDSGKRRAVLEAWVEWDGFTESQRSGVINRVIGGEAAESWMDGVQERAMYQVWHRNGNRHEKVAEVRVETVEEAALIAIHDVEFEDWRDNPSVKAEPGEHRSTDIGDIIIDPHGVEHLFSGHEAWQPFFEEVTTVFEQGYTEYLATRAIEHAAAIGFDPTGVDGYLGTERPAERFDPMQVLESMFYDMAHPPDFEAIAREQYTDHEAAGLRDRGEDYEEFLRVADRPEGEARGPRAAYDRMLDETAQPERPGEKGIDR